VVSKISLRRLKYSILDGGIILVVQLKVKSNECQIAKANMTGYFNFYSFGSKRGLASFFYFSSTSWLHLVTLPKTNLRVSAMLMCMDRRALY